MNICDKYYWITQHPKYVIFGTDAVIEITPHMVCPETNQIENAQVLNTKLQFWVELMMPYLDKEQNQYGYEHDWDMDCGGDTWEEAVEKLYQLVLEKYGDYTQEDIDNHRKAAMGDFDLDAWMKSHKFIAEASLDDGEIEMLQDYEIEAMQEELEHLEKLIPVLVDKLYDINLTPDEYNELATLLTAAEHDILVNQECIRLGYDVEKYGVREESENSETDRPAE